jgi:predicted permease
VLVFVAHLVATPSWWRLGCDALVAVAIALLFVSFGLSLALTAILVERRRNWMERGGIAAGVAGGMALVIIGLIGAWAFLSSSVRGL